MSLDAMKQALEALENGGMLVTNEAIVALQLAIEQAERQDDGDCKRCGGKGCVACDARCLPERQEPVAWWREDGSICTDERQAGDHDIPLYTHRRLIPRDYTAPPQRQPLTEEEIERATGGDRNKPLWIAIENVARAIERAHGIGGGE